MEEDGGLGTRPGVGLDKVHVENLLDEAYAGPEPLSFWAQQTTTFSKMTNRRLNFLKYNLLCSEQTSLMECVISGVNTVITHQSQTIHRSLPTSFAVTFLNSSSCTACFFVYHVHCVATPINICTVVLIKKDQFWKCAICIAAHC